MVQGSAASLTRLERMCECILCVNAHRHRGDRKMCVLQAKIGAIQDEVITVFDL